jgi:hypothetical protein
VIAKPTELTPKIKSKVLIKIYVELDIEIYDIIQFELLFSLDVIV